MTKKALERACVVLCGAVLFDSSQKCEAVLANDNDICRHRGDARGVFRQCVEIALIHDAVAVGVVLVGVKFFVGSACYQRGVLFCGVVIVLQGVFPDDAVDDGVGLFLWGRFGWCVGFRLGFGLDPYWPSLGT